MCKSVHWVYDPHDKTRIARVAELMGLRPFVTDGCSGFLSFTWRMLFRGPTPWEDCCIRHDLAYWQGGPSYMRKQADQQLRKCVARNGHPWWAIILYVAVRIGGPYWLPYPSLRQVEGRWKLSFNEVRWGYGWPYPKYKSEIE